MRDVAIRRIMRIAEPKGERNFFFTTTSTNNIHIYTGCSLNIVFFPSNVVIFLNSASSAAALVFYLPGVFTRTDTERKQSLEYF